MVNISNIGLQTCVVLAFIIIVIILFILTYRLTLGFTFIMDNLVCSTYITVYFGGVFSKKIIIYPRKKKDISKKENAKKIRKKRDINQIKSSLKILLKLFEKSLIINEFKLFIKEGTGNAANTAILYGLIWNIIGLIQTVVFSKYNVRNREFKIETDFKEKVWKVYFNCIFSLKIVNIIFMCREIIKYYLKNRKGGDADVRTSNRRSNDYSHAKY